jgi:hypothetical protein
MWWEILSFCILVRCAKRIRYVHPLTASKSSIGSTLTTIFECNNQKAEINEGACAKPDDRKRALSSLLFSYTVDVATNIATTYAGALEVSLR